MLWSRRDEVRMNRSAFRFDTSDCRLSSRQSQLGGALVEYTIVALFLVLVLIAGQNKIHDLVVVLRESYASFVYALSTSWN
jgi:hypothetical protein